MPTSLPAGLLLGHVADYGQLEHLSLVSLEQQNDPQNERADPQEKMQRNGNEPEERDQSEDRETDAYGKQRRAHEQALEGVEPDKAILVVRLEHQENDRRNE